MREPTRVFRGGARSVHVAVSRHVHGVIHHMNVLADAHKLQSDDEGLDSEYRDRRVLKHQRRAIKHELCGLVAVYDAPETVHDLIERGIAENDTTVAVELNVGQFTSGIDVFEGNKHKDATHSFSLTVGPLNHSKRQTLDEINDATARVERNSALLLVFTGYDEAIHVGVRMYDRANEAVIADPSPSLRERLFGDPY